MEITTAQKIVFDHLEKIGYTKIETTPIHAFLHLIEEVWEVSRVLLHKETPRWRLSNSSDPWHLEEEVADIFWQTLKLASYLNLDLEACFLKTYEKNKNKGQKIQEAEKTNETQQ